ncbi:hypothetical protein TNCV_3974871 [Trichonephila clavipes]|nr:hypothetical protein TNCV_3974871 [Trichonephila clavipes]
MLRRYRARGKESGGYHVTCVISVKKLDDCQGGIASEPTTLTGDFNANFASEEAMPLIEFLKRTLNTDSREGTRYGITIDAVFLIDYNR